MNIPTTCVSPACRSGYPTANKEEEHVTFHRFPSDISLREKWIKKIPRKNWKWNKNHRLCSRHFSADDYKTESLDTNARRRILSYLTKTTKPRSTKLTSSTYRREQASLIVELNDSFGDLKGIKVPISDLPKGVLKVFEHDEHLSFIKLSFEHKPKVEYCLRIHLSLEY